MITDSAAYFLSFHHSTCRDKLYLFQQMPERVKTLAIGSSHGHYGLDPRIIGDCVNFCSPSQDLKYSYLIYSKFAPLLPECQNVLLFFSYFSPGFLIEKSPSQALAAAAMHQIYQLDSSHPNAAFTEYCKHLQASQLPTIPNDLPAFPPRVSQYLPSHYSAADRAADHHRYNTPPDAICYLHHIFAVSRLLRHNLYIVIPPYRSDYISAMLTLGGDRYSGLSEALEATDSFMSPLVLDFHQNGSFTDSDFMDTDHLNPFGTGPSKLSEIIRCNMDLFPCRFSATST